MNDTAPAQSKPSIQEIMADYNKASAFFADTPAEAWEQIQEKTALAVFNETLETVPTYKRFLSDQKFDVRDVKSFNDFKRIPTSDKYNYIQKHGFNEVNTTKGGKNLYSFSLSSGTTDQPTIWPRYYQYEEFLPYIFELFMRLNWQIDKKSTLLINVFALGPCIAGFTVHQGLRPLTQKYDLTLGTCGADIDSILYTIKTLSSYYDQTVVWSYPTFARTILDKLESSKINIRKLNLKMFIAGEGHTVPWRQYINKMISGDPEDVTSIIDGYGTSDAGLAGMGSALTNLIRDLAYKDKQLCKVLFGRADCVPSLFQYSTSSVCMEENSGEILFTTKSTTPLVRYNIHDRGGVIKFRKMEEILKEHGYDYRVLLKKKGLPSHIVWQQPFVYCFGRRDDTVIISGANIFPEQIAPILFNDKIKDVHGFKLATEYDKEQHQLFYVLLELKDGVKYGEVKLNKITKKYHDLILKRMLKVSSDYAASFRADPKYADLNIRIFPYAEGPFKEDLNRTKPRLIAK